MPWQLRFQFDSSAAQFLSLSFGSLIRLVLTQASACGLAFEARFPPDPSSLQLCVESLFLYRAWLPVPIKNEP
jgi:hypothetical protein